MPPTCPSPPARTLLDLAASTDARGRHVMTHQQLVAVIDGVICEHRTRIGLQRRVHSDDRAQQGLAHPADAAMALEPLEIGAVRSPGGRRVHPDLADRRHRLAVQVDGAVHEDPRQGPASSRARTACRCARTRVTILGSHPGSVGSTTSRVHPDLADRRHRLAVQVDGAVHEDPRQRLRDVERPSRDLALGRRLVRALRAPAPGPLADVPAPG
jgi:very-short-patch-repair endonuclease